MLWHSTMNRHHSGHALLRLAVCNTLIEFVQLHVTQNITFRG